MTPNEAYQQMAATRPNLIYVAGKTSTGKSTFARKLQAQQGYALVELDRVLLEHVLPHFDDVPARDMAFVEAYKLRRHKKLIAAFVAAAKKAIDVQQAAGKPVVVEGAVAHAETLFELLGSYADVVILYFHPEYLDVYTGYLTKRLHAEFDDTTDKAGGLLPIGFWKQMGEERRQQFAATHKLTPAMQAAIQAYAEESQVTSLERIAALREYFPDLTVVAI